MSQETLHVAKDLTVMIPAYREGASLATLLPRIIRAASQLTDSYEILIIDTQSPMDDTPKVCSDNGVTHIARSGGNSYGDALRTGIAHAQGRHILCMDADGSHNPNYFPALWSKKDVWDIVIGSRYAPGGHTENPAVLIWMSYVVNWTFRLAFNISAKDVTNSFRLYRKASLERIRLESNEFDVLEELLIKAVTYQPASTIGEVPVTFEKRKAGESKRKLLRFAFGYLSTFRRLKTFQRSVYDEQQIKELG
jgi:dolichol-phosphate mannosyltransferase